MPVILEVYDKALHDSPAPSVQMAQRLLAVVRQGIESGRWSRQAAYEGLLALYEQYEERNQPDELDAVADVLDSFTGWSPLRAAL
jgi:hypothetical protein